MTASWQQTRDELPFGIHGIEEAQRDVRAFNKSIGTRMHDRPHTISPTDARLALSLIDEERRELELAWLQDDLPELADAIVDSIYVLLGLACRLGIEIEPLWAEVHRANMRKVGGPKDSNGKQTKPAGWQPPRIAELLREQGWGGE